MGVNKLKIIFLKFLLLILLVNLFVSEGRSQIFAPEDFKVSPIERTRFQKNFSYASDVTAIALPVATLAGVLISQDWEGLKQGALTALVAGGATFILKLSVRELRPDHSNYHSFPSLHSSATFATAAFLQRRYGWKLGGPAYALATFTAVGRVVGKKHHWWDCVAGAAIGAGSAFLFTQPWAKKHELSVLPIADSDNFGLTASLNF